MVLLRLVLVFALWVSSDLKLLWEICFPSLWLVFWVFTVWLPLSLWSILVCVWIFGGLWLVYPPTDAGTQYTSFSGYGHLAAGLSCGLSCLAAGLSIGIAGDAGMLFKSFVSWWIGVRACGQQDKIFVGMILMLIFGEALALYGLIVSIVIVTVTNVKC